MADPDDHQPLIVQRTRHSSKSQHNDEEEESDAVMASIQAGRLKSSWRFRFAMIFLGIFYLLLGVGVALASLEYSFWLALGLSLGLVIPAYMSAPSIWVCLFRPLAKMSGWRETLYSLSFWAFLLGSAAGCGGGYFLREYRYAIRGVQATSVSPTTVVDAGSIISFTGGTKPYPELGARTAHLGIWPVCIAPLLANPSDKEVNYFAVGNGVCCAGEKPKCHNWDKANKGAIVLHSNQMEFYPSTGAIAKITSGPPNSMLVSPQHKFVIWGDVAVMKSDDAFYAGITLFSTALFVLVLSTWKAVRTDYSV